MGKGPADVVRPDLRSPGTVPAMPLLIALLALMAVGRLARLLTVDRVAGPLRDWIGGVTRDGLGNVLTVKRGELDYLVQCPWCASMYLAPPVMVPAALWPDSTILLICLLSLAGSLVAGLLAQLETILDRRAEQLEAQAERDRRS